LQKQNSYSAILLIPWILGRFLPIFLFPWTLKELGASLGSEGGICCFWAERFGDRLGSPPNFSHDVSSFLPHPRDTVHKHKPHTLTLWPDPFPCKSLEILLIDRRIRLFSLILGLNNKLILIKKPAASLSKTSFLRCIGLIFFGSRCFTRGSPSKRTRVKSSLDFGLERKQQSRFFPMFLLGLLFSFVHKGKNQIGTSGLVGKANLGLFSGPKNLVGHFLGLGVEREEGPASFGPKPRTWIVCGKGPSAYGPRTHDFVNQILKKKLPGCFPMGIWAISLDYKFRFPLASPIWRVFQMGAKILQKRP